VKRPYISTPGSSGNTWTRIGYSEKRKKVILRTAGIRLTRGCWSWPSPAIHSNLRSATGEGKSCKDLKGAGTTLARRQRKANGNRPNGFENSHWEVSDILGTDSISPEPVMHTIVAWAKEESLRSIQILVRGRILTAWFQSY
jgi:hypothetical protein